MLFPSFVLFLFPLFYPQIFCCLYQGSKIFHHLLYDLICSLFHCLALCVFLYFPPSLHPPLILPPLGFSPMERLSYKGNDRTATLDGAALNTDGRTNLKMYMYEFCDMKHVSWRRVKLHEWQCVLQHICNTAYTFRRTKKKEKAFTELTVSLS